MAYKIKKKKPKYEYVLRVQGTTIRAKSMAELNRKLDKGVILWGYKMKNL
jgi:hypothetical protein